MRRRCKAAAESTGPQIQQTWSDIPALNFPAAVLGPVLWSSDGSGSTNFSEPRRGGVIVEGTQVCGLQGPGVWCQGRGGKGDWIQSLGAQRPSSKRLLVVV